MILGLQLLLDGVFALTKIGVGNVFSYTIELRNTYLYLNLGVSYSIMPLLMRNDRDDNNKDIFFGLGRKGGGFREFWGLGREGKGGSMEDVNVVLGKGDVPSLEAKYPVMLGRAEEGDYNGRKCK